MLYNSIIVICLGWNWKSPPRWAFQIRSSQCFLILWSARSPRQPRYWCTPQIAAIEPEQAGELDGPVHAFFANLWSFLAKKAFLGWFSTLMHASNCHNRTWTSTSQADVQKAANLMNQFELVFRQSVLFLCQKGIFGLIFDIYAPLKLPHSNLNKH